METEILKVEKKINAEPARLFRAWTTAKNFSRWFLPGTSVNIDAVTLDARPGGRFRIEMIVDGVLRPHEGEYQIVDEPKKLVFTWRSFMTQDRDSLVTVNFAAEGDGTRLTLIHERLPGDAATVQAHREGWTNIITGLEAWISSLDK
jgi:uncharacterized protein YndB with AHSA1/START domain